jgi:hypothetical protein
LKAGKARSWSLDSSSVSFTGTAGVVSGRLKVDIARWTLLGNEFGRVLENLKG